MAVLKLNKQQQRKVSLFVVCVGVSTIVWGLFAMANHYLYKITAPIQYVNLPSKRAFNPLQPDSVSLNVEGSGWQLLFSRLRLQSKMIEVDIGALKNRNWVTFSSQLGYINRQFDANQRIVSVSPDTLYFDFAKKSSKKVPVKLNYDISFWPQYAIVDTIKVHPAYVTVTGPLDDLAQIDHWETDTLTHKQVRSSIQAHLALQKNQKGNINLYPASVEVSVPIGEVTEKVLEIPIKAEKAKNYMSVKLLPEKVRITVMVSLDDYKRTTSESFEAVVNLDEWVQRKINSLPVLITKVPDFCKLVKVEPQNVDFLIRN
ncbi:hypothetical protein SAMN05216436_11787 [bacterium A37T11]|nr:hypothetical protein SAMN05216436_11787 [bacterium A37T11]